MRYLALFLMVFLMIPLTARAQEDDKTFLERKLQEALSGIGREVSITGFAGALSSNARLDVLTIADADGVWLTMRDARLVWTRSALLSGRLQIQNLSAREIEMTRLPSSDKELTLSDTEVTPFALPELPVSVNIDALTVEMIRLSPDILGETIEMQASGYLTLDRGEGDAKLDILRTDRDDQLSFEGGFSNSTRILRLDLDFEEDEGGLVSTLLRIPGSPHLGLKIEGEAPLSDFTAQIALSSDREPRFGGQVTINSPDDSEAGYTVNADLSGDVRPLFTADLHPFFGEASSLTADVLLQPDGATLLNSLRISSGAMHVTGSLALSPEGWPERFALAGEIGARDRVRLPLSGPATTIGRATISARYDAATGDRWSADISLRDFERETLRFDAANLSGDGMILRAPVTALSGLFTYEMTALDTGDSALNQAIGNNPAGSARFDWKPDAPLTLTYFTLASDDMVLRARLALDQLAQGLRIEGRANVAAEDISRFSALAGRDLTGSAEAMVDGTGYLLSGAFDGTLSAKTEGLGIAEPRLDPLISGKTDLRIIARRDETGLTLDALDLSNQAAEISASGRLNTNAGQFELSSRLANIALVEPRLSGDAELDTRFEWVEGQPLIVDRFNLRLDQSILRANGQIDPDDPALPVAGQVMLDSNDLSRFARLAARPLQGRLVLQAVGAGEINGDKLDVSYDLTGTGVRSGIAQLDQLIAGNLSSTGSVAVSDAPLDLRYFKLSSQRLQVNATGTGPGAQINLSARLSDLAVLTNGLSGPAETRGSAVISDRLARQTSVDLNATGPGGIAARIIGDVRDYGQSLDLDITGTAPLQLANQFITPRSVQGDATFTLGVAGTPQLNSVEGIVTFAGARASLPFLDYTLNDLTGNVALANGRAEITLGGNTGKGGNFDIRGPITLSAPYNADLNVDLQSLVMTDSELYNTTLNGGVGISGPLTGGALINGVINLGRTELRVPSGSGVIIGTLPELRHIAEPAAVRQTRARAGFIGGERGPAASFPLDLTINAPNQIFVRGRGLDAELGGSLRLGGTTSDVRASGVFELIRGRLDILGKRLDLTEGLIDMRGSLDPYLRFVAEAEADDVLVRIILEGLASAPNVLFTSEPDLPQEEVIARLLFGRGLDTISPFQAAQLVSAVAQLTGRYDGGVVGKLRGALGLSDLDVATTEGGATQFRAGAYLSDNLYSEVIADSTGKQQINLNLDLSRRVTVRGSADTEGNTGIGIFFEKDY